MNIAVISIVISCSTLLITIAGWYIVNNLSRKRDIETKKREIVTAYLINAFRLVEGASNRLDGDKLRDFESAIADIQLFGNKEQIKLAQEFSESISNNGNADSLELIKALRKSLRIELELGEAPDKWSSLRFEPRSKSPQTLQSHLSGHRHSTVPIPDCDSQG